MGMADFYLKINFKKYNNDEFEAIYQSFINESIFRILDKEDELNFLTLECKFDNLVPSIIIAFNNLCNFKNNIASIETHGIEKEFLFNNVEEFLEYVFSVNKNQLFAAGPTALPGKKFRLHQSNRTVHRCRGKHERQNRYPLSPARRSKASQADTQPSLLGKGLAFQTLYSRSAHAGRVTGPPQNAPLSGAPR